MSAPEELVDGPDIGKAQESISQAQAAAVKTDRVITETQRAIRKLNSIHQENHFAEKLRLLLRGA